MLRLAFDFIITWRETRTRPNAYTKGARELSPEYLEEIKHYHLNRAERFFMSHNNKQKKEGVYGFENIMFHLILFPVPNKENIVNWFVKRANQIKQDA